jgi:Peptidyl-tRNA hydrolase PTH2
MKNGDKLYLVTRSDLPPGHQAVQSAHAMREFKNSYPELEQLWYERSNFLALLAVPDEASLSRLLERARRRGIPAVGFREPDLGGALTAVALAPRGKGLVRRLPLALAG